MTMPEPAGRGSARADRLPQLQWLRALAAMLVVCFHTDAILSLPKYLGAGVPVFGAGDSGVQLFFVLSGFVIHHAHAADPERSPGAIGQFLRKRARRLYPPLWAILVPITLYLGVKGLADRWDIAAALAITPVPVERVLAVEWTLRHEILFYALFPLLLWRRTAGWIAIAAWAVASAATIAVPVGDGLHWLVTFVLNPNHALFLIGMLTSRLYLSGYRGLAMPALIAGCAGFAATYAGVVTGTLDRAVAIPAYGLSAAALMHGLVAGPLSARRPLWLERAGDASYALYLLHFPLLSILTKLWMMFGPQAMPAWVILLLFAAICQGAALAFRRWIEVPAIAVFDRMWPRAGTVAPPR